MADYVYGRMIFFLLISLIMQASGSQGQMVPAVLVFWRLARRRREQQLPRPVLGKIKLPTRSN